MYIYSCESDGVVGDTYSLLLHSHLSLQELRHVADCQNHVIHTSLDTHRVESRVEREESHTRRSELRCDAARALPYLNQGLHLMEEDGFVAEFHQRLGHAQGERPQPGPVPAHQDQSLHVCVCYWLLPG